MITRIVFMLILFAASAANAQRPGGTYHPPPRIQQPPIIAPPPPPPSAIPQAVEPRVCPQTCWYVYSNCQQPSCPVQCTTAC